MEKNARSVPMPICTFVWAFLFIFSAAGKLPAQTALPILQSLPYNENFDQASLPDGWFTQTSLSTDIWSISATNYAGGSANEIYATWVDETGVSRLVSRAINTSGLSLIKLKFRHSYYDYDHGLDLKIQSSSNMNDWTDEGWVYYSGNGDIDPEEVTCYISSNLGDSTYIAFVVDGNHYNLDGWYIDQVAVTQATEYPLPFNENFNAAAFPADWTVQTTLSTNVWSVSLSNASGGTANEMKSVYVDQSGISRLVTPPLNTASMQMLNLTFRHRFKDDGVGLVVKVQSSKDMVHWTDESFQCVSGNGMIGPELINTQIFNNLGGRTFIGFVLSGDHWAFYNWLIDEVHLQSYSSLPQCGSLVLPANNADSVPLFGTLTWTRDPWCLGQLLYLGTDDPPTNLANGVEVGTQTSYNYTGLNAGTTYYWKVRSYNPAGLGPDCPAGSFTTFPALSLPYSESFPQTVLPAGWAEQCSTNILEPAGGISNSNLAGGLMNEVFVDGYFYQNGVVKMVLPPLNTTGQSEILLNFKHLFIGENSDARAKVQTSRDGLNWSDENLLLLSENGFYGPEELSVAVHHNLNGTTLVAFVVEGNLYSYERWYIDDINISVPADPPACATAKFPAHNASGVNPFGVFAWNHVQAARGYKLYVGTDNPPTNVVNGQDVGYTDHYSFPQLQLSTAYYWMVRPYNSVGEDVTCTPLYFVTADTLTLPYSQAFISDTMPPGWGQQYGGDVLLPLWTVENSNNAGGSPFELSGSWYDGIGSSRLVSPPLNIQGFSGIHVSFLQNYEDWGQGMSIQLQVSYDGSSWANLPYEIISGHGNVGPGEFSLTFNTQGQSIMYLSLLMQGILYNFNFYYFDNFLIEAITAPSNCNLKYEPDNESSNVLLINNFQWQQSNDATNYRLYLGTDNPPTNIINGLLVGNTDHYPFAGLQPSTLYYWNIVPVNEIGQAATCLPWSFTTQAAVNLPFTEDFGDVELPEGWAAVFPPDLDIWNISTTATAGGSANELMASDISFSWTGTTRAVTPPINTQGITMLKMKFKFLFEDYAEGLRFLVQSSADGFNWTDETWSLSSGFGDYGPEDAEFIIGHNLGNHTLISFTLIGDHFNYYDWAIDNIEISTTDTSAECSYYLQPANQGTLYIQEASLIWDLNPTATDFLLNLGTDNPPTNIYHALNVGASYEVALPNLTAGETYYWSVESVNPADTTTNCPVASFNTLDAVELPYCQYFDFPALPALWSQQHQGYIGKDRWFFENSNEADGEAGEAVLYYYDNYGTTRLISPPFHTAGMDRLDLFFRHYYHDYSYGSNFLIQSSSDLVHWTDEEFAFSSGDWSIGPEMVNTSIKHNLGDVTYIALTVIGDHNTFYYWYIDDFCVSAPEGRPAVFNLGGGGKFCPPATGAMILLDGSESDVSYQLMMDGTPVGNPLQGTGSGLSWADQPTGVYSVLASKASNSSQRMMNNWVMVTQGSSIAVDAGPDISITAGASAQLGVECLEGTPPFIYFWSPATGLSATDIPNPAASPLLTTLYTVSVTDASSCVGIDDVMVIVSGGSVDLQSVVTYLNTPQTAMNNTLVQLRDGDSVLSSATTDAAGSVDFNNLAAGVYNLKALPVKDWGGGNATDALLILRHFVGLQPITYPLKLTAADPNLSGFINAVDALMITRRFVGLITGFAAGDWLSENPVFTAVPDTGNINVNFNTLCVGDIDGSYIPAAKTASNASLEESGTLVSFPGETVQIPLSLVMPASIGAYSLILTYPEAYLSVEDLEDQGRQDEILWKAGEGRLALAWYSLKPLDAKAGDVLFSIRAKVRNALSTGQPALGLDYAAFADPEAKPLDWVQLSVPALKVSPLSSSGKVMLYPNPVKGTMHLSLYNAEEGYFDLCIYDLTGRMILEATKMRCNSGTNTYELSTGGLANGVYSLRLVMHTDRQRVETLRLMIEN